MPTIVNRQTGEFWRIDARVGRVTHLRKRCYAWATALDPYLKRVGRGYRLAMMTLTYHGIDGETGEPLPNFGWMANHIRDFMHKLRRNLKDNLLAYAWVAELQRRGAVHYHILILVRAGTHIPYPDRVGWWPHGSSRVETARTIFYIMKYAQKARFMTATGEYLIFPKGLRLFAVWIAQDVIETAARWQFRSSVWPRWLAEILFDAFPGAIPRRAKGGGWTIVDDALGEIQFDSPYKVVLV